jgi:death on curing protein
MIYLTVDQVIGLQALVIAASGGRPGILNMGNIQSAVALPQQAFGGQELYPTVAEKASAIGFSLACNHGFNDGNKRIGHAAMETFLVRNGYEIAASVDEQERTFLDLASHKLTRAQFTDWVERHITPLPGA